MMDRGNTPPAYRHAMDSLSRHVHISQALPVQEHMPTIHATCLYDNVATGGAALVVLWRTLPPVRERSYAADSREFTMVCAENIIHGHSLKGDDGKPPMPLENCLASNKSLIGVGLHIGMQCP